MHVGNDVHEIARFVPLTWLFDNGNDSVTIKFKVSPREVLVDLLGEEGTSCPLCLFLESCIPAGVDNIVTTHNHHRFVLDRGERTKEGPAHTQPKVFLFNDGEIRKERSDLFQIMSSSDKDNVAAAGCMKAAYLVLQEVLPAKREERFLRERPEACGTAGKQEEGFHGGEVSVRT